MDFDAAIAHSKSLIAWAKIIRTPSRQAEIYRAAEATLRSALRVATGDEVAIARELLTEVENYGRTITADFK
jgi:hypothetical protein